MSRTDYAALDASSVFADLIDQGLVSLVRTRKTPFGLRAGAFVGEAQVGSRRLVIAPKVAGTLEALISWAVPLDVRVATPPSLVAKDAQILDVFVAQLLEAVGRYLRTGRIRHYRTTSGVSSTPKGRLDVRGTAALEARGRAGVVAYTTRRLTADTPLNCFLGLGLFAVEEYARSTDAPRALVARARSYAALFEDVSWRRYRHAPWGPALEALHQNAWREAESEDALSALLYGRALLQNLGAWPTEGSTALTVPQSFFVNLESLFEEAVRNAVQGSGYTASKGAVLKRPLFHERSKNFVADPDIVLTTYDPPVLLDTKYRDLEGGLPGHGEVYQLAAHATAFDAKIAALIYPLETGRGEPSRLTSLGTTASGLRMYFAEVDVANLQVASLAVVQELLAASSVTR